MEYVNRTELVGITGKTCRVLSGKHGNPEGFSFQVMTVFSHPSSVPGEGPTVETVWHEVRVFPARGEKLRRYIFEGEAPVHVIGRICADHWSNMHTGETRRCVYIEATEVEGPVMRKEERI